MGLRPAPACPQPRVFTKKFYQTRLEIPGYSFFSTWTENVKSKILSMPGRTRILSGVGAILNSGSLKTVKREHRDKRDQSNELPSETKM